MLWIVPAPVEGTWHTPKGVLTLTQRFQAVSGTLDNQPIESGRVRGDEIVFSVGPTRYAGRVEGYRMRVSTTRDGRRVEWIARHVGR